MVMLPRSKPPWRAGLAKEADGGLEAGRAAAVDSKKVGL